MKRLGILLLAVIAMVGLATHPAAAKKGGSSKYMIMVPHTPEECLKVLDNYDSKKALTKFDFGCEDGDHTAYAIVSASSKDAALAMVPEDMRANAKVVMLTKFTAADLRKAHEQMSASEKK